MSRNFIIEKIIATFFLTMLLYEYAIPSPNMQVQQFQKELSNINLLKQPMMEKGKSHYIRTYYIVYYQNKDVKLKNTLLLGRLKKELVDNGWKSDEAESTHLRKGKYNCQIGLSKGKIYLELSYQGVWERILYLIV